MSVTDEMRKVFDACTVMAGVEPDFECVYMTKGAALLYLDEIDAENDRMREQIDAAHMSRLLTENENESLRELVRLMWKPFCWAQSGCEVCLTDEQDTEIRDKVRELGVDE